MKSATTISNSNPIDVNGMKPVAWMFTVAIPVVGAIGYVGAASWPLLLAFLCVVGFCVLGGQYAINAISAMLIGTHLPVQQLYLLAAIPFVICTPACFVFARLYDARYLERKQMPGAEMRVQAAGIQPE